MSDHSLDLSAAGAAPEQGNTATPESAEHEPQAGQEAPEPKTFTQEDVDALIAKEKAKVERKLRRELTQQPEQTSQPASEAPKPEKFNTVEEYLDALTDYKAEQKISQREQQKQQTTADATYEDRAEEARAKYADFDEVAHNQSVRVTPAMAEVIKASEVGPEIAYHLGSNPKEAARIAALPPLQQAREIGKIEASLSANPPVKKVSSAPEPIKPVGSRTAPVKHDPSDPRSTKEMSTAEWMEARNKQVRAKA